MAHVRVAISGIDGGGKSTLCQALRQALTASGIATEVVGNLPRAYRGTNDGVVDAGDPCLSSFFFNYAAEQHGDPGAARFIFESRYVDYLMALEEARIYREAVTTVPAGTVIVHDRHTLDRRVNALRAGCPGQDVNLILGQVPPADLTVLLDLPAETAVERVGQRGRPGRDENLEDLADYRDLYLAHAQAEPNLLLVDATADRTSVFDVVNTRVQQLLRSTPLRDGGNR